MKKKYKESRIKGMFFETPFYTGQKGKFSYRRFVNGSFFFFFFFWGLLGLFLNGEYIKADWRYAGLNRDTHLRERDIWAVGISRGCCVRKTGLSSYSMVAKGPDDFLLKSSNQSNVSSGKSDRVSQDLASMFASIEMWDVRWWL